jgi:phage-related minor tail protein
MAEKIGSLAVKIGLDSSGFQNGIGDINRQLKVLDSGFKANTASLGANGKGVDGLKLKSENLASSMVLQKQKVTALEEAHKKSVETKGKDAKATQELEIKLNGAKAALSNMGTTLDAANKQIEVQSSGWTKTGAALSGAGTKLQEAGRTFSLNSAG